MKRKSPALTLLSWIHDILLFEGIYVLAAAIQNIRGTGIGPFLAGGLLLLVPVILSYILICRCRNLCIFLASALAVTWGMKIISQSLLTGCLTAFIFLFRCYVKLKQGEIRRKMKELPNEAGAGEDKELWEIPTLLDSPRPVHCLIFVLLYLGILYLHRYALLPFMLGILAAEMCVCMAFCYLERLDGFVTKNISVANLPSGTMKRIGTGILLIGVAGLIVFLLPAAVYHEEPLANLRFDLSDTGTGKVEYLEENTRPDPVLNELMRLKAQAKETPKWLEKISETAVFLTLLLMFYLAVKLILKAVKKAMESFSGNDDEIIFLKSGEDSPFRKTRILSRKEKDGFLSPGRRIRRTYKRLIRHRLKEKPCGSETPLELEHKAGLYTKETEDMVTIHAVYEKARYGKEECTKEEAGQYARMASRL